MDYFRREIKEFAVLMRSVPATVVTLFVVSVISMNLLANKTLVQTEFIALDGGMLISWLSFMCMDVLTKHFGLKAANSISVLAAAINLMCCVIYSIAGSIPSTAADYTEFDRILNGTWFILLSSTAAFLLSAYINNGVNWLLGKLLASNKNEKRVFLIRTYVSTMLGQFMDNFIFSVLVFMFFAPRYWDGFSWTLLQCTSCALTGALAELLMEILFSPYAYRVVKRWEKDAVGREDFAFIKKGEEI